MIVLRKIEPEDLPYLYQWENDAAAWADGSNHNPLSKKDLRDYIASSTGDIYRDGQLRLIAEADGCTAGCVDLFDLDIRNCRAAVGVYVAEEYRDKGYGRETVAAVERYAFGFLHLRTLYAIAAEGNTGSRKIFEENGFQSVGPLEGWTLEGAAWLYIKRGEE